VQATVRLLQLHVDPSGFLTLHRQVDRPLSAVGSTGGRNARGEGFSWRLVVQGFSGAFVELAGDRVGRSVPSLRQSLAWSRRR
jgi:hypothetical protein